MKCCLCLWLLPVLLVAVVAVVAVEPASAERRSTGVNEKSGAPKKEGVFNTKRLTLEPTFHVKSAKPGDRVVYTLKVTVAKGFHAYAPGSTSPGVSLKFSDAAGLKAQGETDYPLGDPHKTDFWLTETFEITQTFLVPKNAKGTLTIKGTLGYMVCTEQICEPPTSTTFHNTLVIKK